MLVLINALKGCHDTMLGDVGVVGCCAGICAVIMVS